MLDRELNQVIEYGHAGTHAFIARWAAVTPEPYSAAVDAIKPKAPRTVPAVRYGRFLRTAPKFPAPASAASSRRVPPAAGGRDAEIELKGRMLSNETCWSKTGSAGGADNLSRRDPKGPSPSPDQVARVAAAHSR